MNYAEVRAEFFDWRVIERFWMLVDKRSETECWPWLGTFGTVRGKYPYGRFMANGQQYMAHRVAYVLNVGPIPENYTIDHVRKRGCAGGLCVNPSHLEAVTGSENMLRYWEGHDGRECPHGHGWIARGQHCKACAVAAVAHTQRSNPEKYREMKRLQKRKERARQTTR